MPIKFFAQRPIFLRLGSPSLNSLPEDLYSGFLRHEKIHRPQPDLNPRNLDFEASAFPQGHRDRLPPTLDVYEVTNPLPLVSEVRNFPFIEDMTRRHISYFSGILRG